MREKMIEFLQKEYPHALPRQRIEMETEGRLGRGTEDRRPFAEANLERLSWYSWYSFCTIQACLSIFRLEKKL